MRQPFFLPLQLLPIGIALVHQLLLLASLDYRGVHQFDKFPLLDRLGPHVVLAVQIQAIDLEGLHEAFPEGVNLLMVLCRVIVATDVFLK